MATVAKKVTSLKTTKPTSAPVPRWNAPKTPASLPSGLGRAQRPSIEHEVVTAASLLGLKSEGFLKLHQQIKEGIPVTAVDLLQAHLNLSPSKMAQTIHITERTLTRRRAAGILLPEEANRVFRVADIFKKTVDLFEGNMATAANWLKTPAVALGGLLPIDLVETEAGAMEVESLIGRLEYGVFS